MGPPHCRPTFSPDAAVTRPQYLAGTTSALRKRPASTAFPGPSVLHPVPKRARHEGESNPTTGEPSSEEESPERLNDIDSDESLETLQKRIEASRLVSELSRLTRNDRRPDEVKKALATLRATYNLNPFNATASESPEREIVEELYDPADDVEAQNSSRDARKYTKVLNQVFLIKDFRKNQLTAIVKTMMGQDLLILMPTGGGKSLCYQLPAVVQSKEARAVTVVVSPLRALIYDQVEGLRCKEVDALSFQDTNHNAVYKRMHNKSNPPALLYVTPEKLKCSDELHDTLRRLYRDGRLARFAIDEAHCISAWGYEFRDAYRELHVLRDRYPDVPIMALTSTATSRTIFDIISSLKLRNPAIIRQSLNRPNLTYEVVQKRNDILDIVKFIKDDHTNETGIIYVARRSRSEQVAKSLNHHGIKAKHYHAKMADTDKTSTQTDWQTGKTHVIVATIAFGLGIDKPNVRFVIHDSLPASLENYFQETGRAGRDGHPATCRLYYSFQDLKFILSPQGGASQPSIERQRDAMAVVEYCREKCSCRRVLLLRLFGEKFDEKTCGGRCDNCLNRGGLYPWVLTKKATQVIALVRSVEHEKITIKQIIQMFRGSKTADTRQNKRDRNRRFGIGGDPDIAKLAEPIFDELLYLNVLEEYNVLNNQRSHYYARVGPEAMNFMEDGSLILKVLKKDNSEQDSQETPVRETRNSRRTGAIQRAAF